MAYLPQFGSAASTEAGAPIVRFSAQTSISGYLIIGAVIVFNIVVIAAALAGAVWLAVELHQ